MENRKNIVLCSDGTGNTMIKGRGTNVWKLYEAVDLTAHRWSHDEDGLAEPGREQVAFYDDGVGSEENKILKIVGGAFGYGLKRNVRDLYKSLCRAYRPGDQIYLFGFSRGAYTARVLAGLILSCGIIKPEYCRNDKKLDELTRDAYKAFRAHFKLGTTKGSQAINAYQKVNLTAEQLQHATQSDAELLTKKLENSKLVAVNAIEQAESARKEADEITDKFRHTHSIAHDVHAPDGQVKIKFVGVWDTVAAVGLPFKWLTDFWNRFVYPFKFPDYLLSPNVEKGCHAISIDDERMTFHPMMWDERNESKEGPAHVEQVWFAGVHSNVGGGYPKQGMSLVTLDWMMHRAEEQGLVFITSERKRYRHLQNVHDKLYDSRRGLAMYYRYSPRIISEICRASAHKPRIHVSVLERIALGTQDYAPGNLPGQFEITTTDSGNSAAIEDPASLQKIVDDIDSETAAKDVQRWIDVRRFIYLGFIAVTLSVIWIAARHQYLSEDKEPWVPASWDATLHWIANLLPLGGTLYDYLLRPFLVYWNYALLAVAILLVFYLAREKFRSKLQIAFAAFWRNKLPGPWW